MIKKPKDESFSIFSSLKMTNSPKTAKTRSAADNFDSSSSNSITAVGSGDNDGVGDGGNTQIKNKRTNCFVPLESNPDALNKLLSLMGFDINQYCFVDVISFDESILDKMVPKPVVGILLAMPSSSSSSNDSSFDYSSSDDDYKHIWHASQIIGGSCCSLAVLHLIMNLIVSTNRQIDNNTNEEFSNSISGLVKQNSWLEQQFIMTNQTTTGRNNSKERGMVLASDIDFAKIHQTVAESTPSINQTNYNAYPKGQRTGTHFISFVPIHKVNENDTGRDDDNTKMMLMSMVELDGRKKFPIIHGDTSMESFLEDACKLIQNDVMNNKTNQQGENIKFSVLALAASTSRT